jgi:hypothetical protein
MSRYETVARIVARWQERYKRKGLGIFSVDY